MRSLSQELSTLTEGAIWLSSLDVLDVAFSSGHSRELYVANSVEQHERGLSYQNQIDLDGMIFYHKTPTYRPYSMREMKFNLDFGWYDLQGKLLDRQTRVAGDTYPVVTGKPFTYVVEAPQGNLPEGDIRIG